jgi:sulfur transfer protein SufE
MSKSLPSLAPEERIDIHEVHGCEARVWLALVNGQLQAHAESKVIRGILALLVHKYRALSNAAEEQNHEFAISQDKKSSRSFDYSAYLSDLGLSAFFSESRRDGVHAVIQRIKSF